MGSDSEDDERSASKSPKHEVEGGKNKSSTEVREETDKMSAGESKQKRKRAKRSSSDSQKHGADANAETEEASEKNSNNVNPQKRKRKSKISSESEEPEEKAENSSLKIKKMPVSSENEVSIRKEVEAKWKHAGYVDPKVRVPMFTDPGLPLGWRRECVQRKTGKTEGLYDVYIFSPEGKKFRSRVELAKFLAATDLDLDPEEFDFSVYGRKGYALNSATKKKIKSILEMSTVSTPEKEDVETVSVTPKHSDLGESSEVKRTYIEKGRKSKDKITSLQPQKKASLAATNSAQDPEDSLVHGRKGHALNNTTKKTKPVLEVNNSVSVPEDDVEIDTDTQKPDKQSDSGEAKRTSVKKSGKSKDKINPPKPQRKARLKLTPTLNEIFKHASENPFCLDCGKTDCKYPYVELRDIADCGMLTSREGQIVFISDI